MWVSDEALAGWKPRPSRKRAGQRKFSDRAIETALALRLIFKLPLRQAEGLLASLLGLMGRTVPQRGGQRKFSDHAIETALALRLILKLPLRQAQGLLASLLRLMGTDLGAPDHTTVSRRSRKLSLALDPIPASGPTCLIIDSAGLSIVGQGEWAASMHGKRGERGWRKLHLGVNEADEILAQVLTHSNVDDAQTGIELIEAVGVEIETFIADAAYDTRGIYDAVQASGGIVIVPPVRTASASRSGRSARDRTVRRVKEVGRRRWMKESGYHRQGRVENTFFRYKQL